MSTTDSTDGNKKYGTGEQGNDDWSPVGRNLTLKFNLIPIFVSHSVCLLFCRKKAEVNMEGQFLVRQIYEDEITYNLIGAAVEILSTSFVLKF